MNNPDTLLRFLLVVSSVGLSGCLAEFPELDIPWPDSSPSSTDDESPPLWNEDLSPSPLPYGNLPPEIEPLSKQVNPLTDSTTVGTIAPPAEVSPLPVPESPIDSPQDPAAEQPQDPVPGNESANPLTGAIDADTLHQNLLSLRIVELMPDPPGTDGSINNPEYVEIWNSSEQAVSLDELVIESRSWPKLDATKLNLQGRSLAGGQLLVVQRFANADDLAQSDDLHPQAITASFTGGSGLRNTDGAILIRDSSDDSVVDVVQYGAPQPAPFDAAGHWHGAALELPEANKSLCRTEENLVLDTDQAHDFSACERSPGMYPPSPSADPSADPAEVSTTQDTSFDDISTVATSAQSDDAIEDDHSESVVNTTTSSNTLFDTNTSLLPPAESISDSTTDASVLVSESGSESTPQWEDDPTSQSTVDTSSPAGCTSSGDEVAHPQVVVTHVAPNPAGPASTEHFSEFIRIENVGVDEQILDGWSISDERPVDSANSESLVYVSGDGGCGTTMCLSPGFAALVVGSDFDDLEQISRLTADLLLKVDDRTIGNRGLAHKDPVVLFDAGNNMMSTYRIWADPNAEPNPTGSEYPLERIDRTGPDTEDNWRFIVP